MDLNGLAGIGLGWPWLTWVGLGLGWPGFVLAGLGWVGLGQVGASPAPDQPSPS